MPGDLIERKVWTRLLLKITFVLLVPNLANTKYDAKHLKMTETLAHGYSSDSTQQELSNEHQHDKV